MIDSIQGPKRRRRLWWIALGLPGVLFITLWAGTARAQPPLQPQSNYDFYASYTVPHQRAQRADELAAALDIRAEDLISASVLSAQLERSFAVFGRVPGTWFPTRGDTFLWLSTGDAWATTFLTPTSSTNRMADDLDRAELYLKLRVPPDMTCANFDFAFYTREPHPDSLHARNDFFVAQLNTHTLTIPPANSALAVVAPGNFALDRQGEMVTVQSVYAAPAVADPPATTGAVGPLLRASVAVSPGQTAEIYLTLRDAGDTAVDSAVAADHFHWSSGDCTTGALGDRDEDGLPDAWERYGMTLTVATANGPIPDFVNLPLMGADPDHRDIFVEIDHMRLEHPVTFDAIFDYTPSTSAIMSVVQAFDQAPVRNVDGTPGIHLHVDYGKRVPLQWPNAANTSLTWDSWDNASHQFLGDGGKIPFAQYALFCPDPATQDWTAVDQIKLTHLKKARALVFHYAIWGHQLCDLERGVSGISRNWHSDTGAVDYFGWGASDFLVTLGDGSFQQDPQTMLYQEAGTFMHELGHNLGLMHGGGDHVQYKPNHLSVMNGSFQLSGLIRDGEYGYFDYARFAAPALTTTRLVESLGVYTLGQHSQARLGTEYYCATLGASVMVTAAWQGIDWNCNKLPESGPVSATILETCDEPACAGGVLTSVDEWQRLAYTGGLLRRNLNILSPDQLPRATPSFLGPAFPESMDLAPPVVPVYPPEPDLLPPTTDHDEVDASEYYSKRAWRR